MLFVFGCNARPKGELLVDFFNLGDDDAAGGGGLVVVVVDGCGREIGSGIGTGDSRSNVNAFGDWPKLIRVLLVANVFEGDLVCDGDLECGGDLVCGGDRARDGDRGRMAGENVVDIFAKGLKGEFV